ncbi:YfbM family protein [Lysobacter humi (ex Lee et al. 2017)]
MGMLACLHAVDAATLERLRDDPELIEALIDEEDGEPTAATDLDKAWHCIHYMLTGDAWGGDGPLAAAILGGEPAGEDVGYGPARLLRPGAVREVATALAGIDDAEFRSRFDPPAMQAADVYLADMCARDADEALDYLVENFRELVRFYSGAAERGDGVVLSIC